MAARPTTLGGYEVLAELDSGGMGEVLIARKKAVGGFERLVALKTVRGELAGVGAAREMFLDEGRLLAKLHHRGIAQVYDFGEDGDRLYLAMEYVAGVDFVELVERLAPPRIVCLAMAEVCRALRAAHELTDTDGTLLGVVHRDVSPGNLMLTFDGQVKVLDFGIALMRNRRAPVTEFGMLKGKPPYMAPEQVRSEAVDARTDVFSASAVLWELLAGERLFTGDSIYAIGRSIEQGNVPSPAERRDGLGPDLCSVVLKGLSKDPGDRFQSAGEFAEALEKVARELGDQSLVDYASHELADDRKAHEAYLEELIRHVEGVRRRIGRKTSVNTIPALDGIEGIDDEPLPEPREPREPRPAKWPLYVLILSLFGALGVFMLLSEPGETDELASNEVDAGFPALDAALADASSAARDASSIDARVVVAVAHDAGRSPDARQKTKRAPKKPVEVVRPPKPPRADAGAPKIAGKGTVTILHKRGGLYANVRIDGRSIGPTPVNVSLTAGPHVVSWIEPDSNSVRHRRSIIVEPNKHATIRSPR